MQQLPAGQGVFTARVKKLNTSAGNWKHSLQWGKYVSVPLTISERWIGFFPLCLCLASGRWGDSTLRLVPLPASSIPSIPWFTANSGEEHGCFGKPLWPKHREQCAPVSFLANLQRTLSTPMGCQSKGWALDIWMLHLLLYVSTRTQHGKFRMFLMSTDLKGKSRL